MTTFRLLEEDQLKLASAAAYSVALHDARQSWREYVCSEATGGRHDYHLEICDGQARLFCDVCGRDPAGESDLQECVEMSPVPVSVEIVQTRHQDYFTDEWDVAVLVVPR